MVVMNDPVPSPDHPTQTVAWHLRCVSAWAHSRQGGAKRATSSTLASASPRATPTLGQIGFEARVDYAAIGTIPNLAARLCSEADAGQILVSQRVWTSVEHEIEATPIGELVLKGIHRPVAAYDVIRVRNGESKPEPSSAPDCRN